MKIPLVIEEDNPITREKEMKFVLAYEWMIHVKNWRLSLFWMVIKVAFVILFNKTRKETSYD